MVAARDRRMNVSTADARKDRAHMAAAAQSQGGVDALEGKFPTRALLRDAHDDRLGESTERAQIATV